MKKCIAGLLAALALAGQAALAVDWVPDKPVELVVPAGPGAGIDQGARIFARHAQKLFGQPVVIVNVKGASGHDGMKTVHEAGPDGHKVLFFDPGIVIAHVSGISPYAHDGFEVGPTVMEDGSLTLYAGRRSRIRNVSDMVAAARDNPGRLKVATGYGSFSYFLLLKMQKELEISLDMVEVGGDAGKIAAMLDGVIDLMPMTIVRADAYLETGDMHAVGLFQDRRQSSAPQIPTFREQGFNLHFPSFAYTLFFPKGTSADVLAAFDKVARQVTANPVYRSETERIGFVAAYKPAAEAARRFDAIRAEFGELARIRAEVRKIQ